ncbi:Rhodanese-like domain-containing protein [Exophiala viscosa]|uniref:Rhodanese-like domain-containing protein n=1 Tax=Exophiala viscosa TaxID=2486360 RepID=A0AAN6E5T9_9EURO|nr:Rhodanese-like domain-containing protein [Exophiala viscosa]KAI1627762.1 Rhodanese-like domain-containing protein [Exophiala viscosa]
MSSSSAPVTLSSLEYMQGATLAPLLLDPEEQPKIAIIDVRDSDHIGGNIAGSTWIPLNQLDARLPELLRTLKDKEKVVFHCMLSQQRGPKAALLYARSIQSLKAKEDKQQARQDSEDAEQKTKQQVYVLQGGFGQWQAEFGQDPRLTADYEPDIWL